MTTEPFLIQQGIQRLAEVENPRQYLHPDFFRSRRLAAGVTAQFDRGPWDAVSRDSLLGWISNPKNLKRRFALTTDAGVGKSVNLEWMLWQLCEKHRTSTAFLLKLGDLATQLQNRIVTPELFIDDVLIGLILRKCGLPEARRPEIRRNLMQLQNRGELILLFDELDQVSVTSTTVEMLAQLLESPLWSRTTFVIGGRPYALQDCWEKLFARREQQWTFLQLDGFTTQQQETYLRDADGRNRYEDLPEETRTELQDILSVPRVLAYLRQLPTHEFQSIRTPSDVYERAAYHLVEMGMKKDRAHELGKPPGQAGRQQIDGSQVRLAIKILSVLAWEMLWIQPPDAQGDEKGIPNFNRVSGASKLDSLYERAYWRLSQLPNYDKTGFEGFTHDIERLKSMNEAISHGIIDSKRMEQILWRNRSLQEFFAAYCLGTFCQETDKKRLWEWIYQANESRTEAFYWIWRFAAELSDDEIRDDSWVTAMSPLYHPGDGTPKNTKRSNELLFRTWDRMQRLGTEVIDQFLGEFQHVLDQRQGAQRAKLANQFKSLFREVPGGKFRMGTTKGKQRMPKENRDSWTDWLERAADDPETFAEQRVAMSGFPPSSQGDRHRMELKNYWLRIIREGGVNALEQWFYPMNETPDELWKSQIESFLLNRYPTLVSWYRLYDPGLGLNDEWFMPKLKQVSPTEKHPVIFVTWYDAWAFCKWAYWDNQSCRLPHEDEWEKAAKAGTAWDWRYWWGDKFDESKCTADQYFDDGTTTPPEDYDRERRKHAGDHTNPWGFVDMLGNVWEWTEDEYRHAYSLDGKPDRASRVCRGGSWDYDPWYVRSAVRYGEHPTNLGDPLGFRVARAL